MSGSVSGPAHAQLANARINPQEIAGSGARVGRKTPTAANLTPAHDLAEGLRFRIRGTVTEGVGSDLQTVCGFSPSGPVQPDVVVSPAGSADVATAVRVAQENGFRIAMWNTGHGPGPATHQPSVAIVVRNLRGIRVDPLSRTAWVQAGATWADVVNETGQFGLMPTVGSSMTVGATGYLLGGGIGLLSREFGFGADRVRSMDVVTDRGIARTVSHETFGDLFWALCGGGHGLGAVTAIEIELDPVPSIYGGGLFFPARAAAEVLGAFSRWSATLPDQASASLAIVRFESGSGPLGLAGRSVVHVRFAMNSTDVEAQALVEPLRSCAPLLAENLRRRPVTELAEVHFDPPGPLALREGNVLMSKFDDPVASRFLESAGPDSASMMRLAEIRLLGGAMARPAQTPNAVPHRHAQVLVHASAASATRWGPTVPGEAGEQVREFVAGFESIGGDGVAVNFSSDVVDERFYDARGRSRLTAVKRAYDPNDTFLGVRTVPQPQLAGRPGRTS